MSQVRQLSDRSELSALVNIAALVSGAEFDVRPLQSSVQGFGSPSPALKVTPSHL
jgi:hypothetical protein